VTYTFDGLFRRHIPGQGNVMSHHCYTTVDELRSWTRFAKERGTDVAVVFHPRREQILADVHDESLSGIGLYMEDVACFDIGQDVEIIYDNEFFRARVRHIEPQQHGDFIVGFDCERAAGPEGY